jgi:hypothetical protein
MSGLTLSWFEVFLGQWVSCWLRDECVGYECVRILTQGAGIDEVLDDVYGSAHVSSLVEGSPEGKFICFVWRSFRLCQ